MGLGYSRRRAFGAFDARFVGLFQDPAWFAISVSANIGNQTLIP